MSFSFPPVPEKLIKAISDSSKVNIVSHMRADGDCVHSSYAMKRILEKAGKKVFLSNPGPFDLIVSGEKDNFLDHLVPEADLIMMIDCSSADRIGCLYDEIGDRPVVVIDHHGSGNKVSGESYIVPQSPSTTLVVQNFLKSFPGVVLDKEIAQDIFYGFVTDTGFFKFLHQNAGCFLRYVSELADSGVDIGNGYLDMYGGRPFSVMKAFGDVIHLTRFHFGGKLAVVCETQEHIDSYEEGNGPSDIFYDQMQLIKGVDTILYLEPKDNGRKTKIGFRSTGFSDTDVGQIALEFGGGGHVHASGATVDMPPEKALAALLDRFSKVFREND